MREARESKTTSEQYAFHTHFNHTEQQITSFMFIYAQTFILTEALTPNCCICLLYLHQNHHQQTIITEKKFYFPGEKQKKFEKHQKILLFCGGWTKKNPFSLAWIENCIARAIECIRHHIIAKFMLLSWTATTKTAEKKFFLFPSSSWYSHTRRKRAMNKNYVVWEIP